MYLLLGVYLVSITDDTFIRRYVMYKWIFLNAFTWRKCYAVNINKNNNEYKQWLSRLSRAIMWMNVLLVQFVWYKISIFIFY